MSKLVFGVGHNDIKNVFIDGKKLKSYTSWQNMLNRVYSDKCHKINPTYIGCSVCKKWLTFSNYKEWYDTNYIEGYQVDKDILVSGNKIYSPETCRFVPRHINNLLIDSGASRGTFLIGVKKAHPKQSKEFIAQCSTFNIVTKQNNKSQHVGCFNTELEAHLAYKTVKENNVKLVAQYYYDQGLIQKDIYNALMSWIV